MELVQSPPKRGLPRWRPPGPLTAAHAPAYHRGVPYYRLRDDIHFPDRWYLGEIDDPTVVDNWTFTTPGSTPRPASTVEVHRPGRQMDFTVTEAFGVPIVSASFKAALADTAGAAFLPIRIRGVRDGVNYFVLYIEHEVACVDEQRSAFEMFTVDDPVRPDLAGMYRGFFKLVIDEPRAVQSGHGVYRLTRAHNVVIVSESIRYRILSAGVTGTAFTECR